jgi:hypothetical protein
MTTMDDSMMPVEGFNVITAEHDLLGTVKEVTGDCFKIDAPMAPDYWLGSDTIGSINGENILLRLRKDEVNEYKMGSPDSHSGIHKHAA